MKVVKSADLLFVLEQDKLNGAVVHFLGPSVSAAVLMGHRYNHLLTMVLKLFVLICLQNFSKL